jgi:hypothetical protein
MRASLAEEGVRDREEERARVTGPKWDGSAADSEPSNAARRLNPSGVAARSRRHGGVVGCRRRRWERQRGFGCVSGLGGPMLPFGSAAHRKMVICLWQNWLFTQKFTRLGSSTQSSLYLS